MPLGFDPNIFHPDTRSRLRIRNELGLEQTTIGYFGRMIPMKGLDVLLLALKRIEGESWQLLLDSFGSYKDPYEEKVSAIIEELGLSDRVIFFDARHEEIADYMRMGLMTEIFMRAARAFFSELRIT